jgi:uncharacterized protein
MTESCINAFQGTNFLYVKETVNKGMGVFTIKQYKTGEKLLNFKGNIVDVDEVEDHAKYLQIGNRLFIGSSGEPDDFINHSCEPNCGLAQIEGQTILIAIKDIQPYEELTFDYSTWMSGDHWEMECLCGTVCCRKKVRDFKYLPIPIQKFYIDLGVVPDFVLNESITDQKKSFLSHDFI